MADSPSGFDISELATSDSVVVVVVVMVEPLAVVEHSTVTD